MTKETLIKHLEKIKNQNIGTSTHSELLLPVSELLEEETKVLVETMEHLKSLEYKITEIEKRLEEHIEKRGFLGSLRR